MFSFGYLQSILGDGMVPELLDSQAILESQNALVWPLLNPQEVEILQRANHSCDLSLHDSGVIV